MSASILIGGATGSVPTKLLLEKGIPVRAFVHKDDERAHKLQTLGAEIFVREDQAGLLRLCDSSRHRFGRGTFAQAAPEAKAEFIVNPSRSPRSSSNTGRSGSRAATYHNDERRPVEAPGAIRGHQL